MGKAYSRWFQCRKTPKAEPDYGRLFDRSDVRHGIIDRFSSRLLARLAGMDRVARTGNDGRLGHHESSNSVLGGATAVGAGHTGNAKSRHHRHVLKMMGLLRKYVDLELSEIIRTKTQTELGNTFSFRVSCTLLNQSRLSLFLSDEFPNSLFVLIAGLNDAIVEQVL